MSSRYTADNILIATGSKTVFTMGPEDFEGLNHCITSDDIFAMETLPKSMAIIGGGYIGVEMGNIMNAFGVKTTLLVREVLLGRVD